MQFITFELYPQRFFPALSIGGESGTIYPFTTSFQTSNPGACKNSLILMIQKS
jgi:hypothetical protein